MANDDRSTSSGSPSNSDRGLADATPLPEERAVSVEPSIHKRNESNEEQPFDFSLIEAGLPGYTLEDDPREWAREGGRPSVVINEDAIGYSSVAYPVSKRDSNESDVPSSVDPYSIYLFYVYDYSTKQDFFQAVSNESLTDPIGNFELTFDQTLSRGHENILMTSEQIKEIRFLAEHQDQKRGTKYCLQLTDLGGAWKKINYHGAIFWAYSFTGGGTTKHAVINRPTIKIHPGGPNWSAQCATSPATKYKPARSNTSRIEKEIEVMVKGKASTKKVFSHYEATDELMRFEEYIRGELRMTQTNKKALIILPGKSMNYPP